MKCTILLLCCLLCLTLNAQTDKPTLYVCFKNDTLLKMYKRDISFKNKLSGKDYKYILYDFNTTFQQNHYQFVRSVSVKPLIVRSLDLKKLNPKPWTWLMELNERLPATYSKYFPYKNLYLVEKLAIAKYQIVKVDTFIGQDY